MSNNTTISLNRNADSTLDRPTNAKQPQLSYFDTITQRLDTWHAQQQAIKEAKAQLTKTFLLTDPDSINGIVKTYRLTVELVSTEQADALELEEQAAWDMLEEVKEYVS